MAGIYSITKKVDHETKFACMVSFNSKEDQYYDMDLPDVSDDVDAGKTIENFIDLTLQAAADADESIDTVTADKIALVDSISVLDGKAIIS